MSLPALPRIMIEPLVRMALLEDIGRAGDLTTDAIVPVGHRATTHIALASEGPLPGSILLGSPSNSSTRQSRCVSSTKTVRSSSPVR